MELMTNSNLGIELAHLRADIRKILFRVGVRILFTAFIIVFILLDYILLEPSGNHTAKKTAQTTLDAIIGISVAAIFVITYMVYVFSPLFHCRDSMIFYQNGIGVGKKHGPSIH